MWNLLRKASDQDQNQQVLAEPAFQQFLYSERKRSERSHRRFVLMLLEPRDSGLLTPECLKKVLHALPGATRATDIAGWYRDGSVIGVIFTEVGTADEGTIERALSAKIADVVHKTLPLKQADELTLSAQIFPAAGDRMFVATA